MPDEKKNKKREYEKNRYYTMLEEKNKKREYARNRYCNMSEEKKFKKRVCKKQISHNDKGMLIIEIN